MRLSAVETSPRGISVSATKPVCACAMLPAKRYPPLLKMWSTTPGVETSSKRSESSPPSAASSSSAIRALALTTLSSADAAKASPRAGKSVDAVGGMTQTTLS